ncbi:hypothetical protein, conserved [Eimeria brunetti]|uniref:Uncharacterized protein n=1 Tax=Eimeria brunetti TaxID=51314 RepID=U6LVW7_9EIME|nr:hypothetical protein, conserved [Eimeria brunetti]
MKAAAAAAARGPLPAEGPFNKVAKAQFHAFPRAANTPKARLRKGQTLSNRSSTSSNDGTTAISNSSSNTSSSSNGDAGAASSRGCSEEDAEALQEAVEESFSVFDVIYRNSLSTKDQSRTASATENGKPTRSKPRTTEPENVQKGVDSNKNLAIPYPSSRAGDGPAVLLSVLRDLNHARIRTPEAWAPHLLLLMQQLPLLSSSEIQQATALLAAAGCRPPLLLQGLCEAYRWRAAAKQTEASQTILFLDSLRRLRYLPCVSHLLVYFGALERRRKSLTVGELLKIQRFLDELSVPSDVTNLPFLVSILPQLKRNATSLKPPEAAALAALLLKRQELDRQTAECLSAAVYEHLGGPSSVLVVPHEPFPAAAAAHMSQAHKSEYLKSQYFQNMLQQQQERLASPSSLSSLLHLGNSLAAANLKQSPSEDEAPADIRAKQTGAGCAAQSSSLHTELGKIAVAALS